MHKPESAGLLVLFIIFQWHHFVATRGRVITRHKSAGTCLLVLLILKKRHHLPTSSIFTLMLDPLDQL